MIACDVSVQSTPGHALQGVSGSPTGIGVRGNNNALSGATLGVLGQSDSPAGRSMSLTAT